MYFFIILLSFIQINSFLIRKNTNNIKYKCIYKNEKCHNLLEYIKKNNFTTFFYDKKYLTKKQQYQIYKKYQIKAIDFEPLIFNNDLFVGFSDDIINGKKP